MGLSLCFMSSLGECYRLKRNNNKVLHLGKKLIYICLLEMILLFVN